MFFTNFKNHLKIEIILNDFLITINNKNNMLLSIIAIFVLFSILFALIYYYRIYLNNRITNNERNDYVMEIDKELNLI